ncbi:Mg2+ transporter protein, CorA-like [marine gamma proteobacterium HTCC2143]|jgi:zinc transporter|uniref:Mg2+ transporter protein, CorA-like n=1 Tax=marine gamma proteobacterium HTCC2143 TaxID=247633 RepID=A0YH86_9GAMM|nr:Mg2+ transporter protein, CorA-like [marine gamma proteobacterium HTCC2143]
MIDFADPCFVFGLNLDSKGGASDFESDNPDSSWLHIDYSGPSAASFLGSQGLPERIVNSLVQPDTRPRTVISKAGTLVFIRGINLNPGENPEDMVSLRMWIEGNRLITVRQRPMLSLQDIRSELRSDEGPTSIPDLVVTIISKIADRISDYVDNIEEQLVGLETSVQLHHEKDSRTRISAIRREIAGVRRYLAPQRDALDALYSHSITSMPEGYAYRLREQMDRMIRYLEDLDLIRERTLVLQEEWMNISMEQQNSRMYALSIVALIFLPITFVTGIFGMNVAGVPGTENPNAFIVVTGFMFVTSVSVIAFLKIKRWF